MGWIDFLTFIIIFIFKNTYKMRIFNDMIFLTGSRFQLMA